jgi:hypothetical protein
MTAVSREQLCGHIPPVSRKHAIMEVMFPMWSVPRIYNEEQLSLRDIAETVVRRVGC